MSWLIFFCCTEMETEEYREVHVSIFFISAKVTSLPIPVNKMLLRFAVEPAHRDPGGHDKCRALHCFILYPFFHCYRRIIWEGIELWWRHGCWLFILYLIK